MLLVVETAILAVVLVLLFGLLRSHAAILRQLHELEGGESPVRDSGPAPVRIEDPATPSRPISGVNLAGEQVVLSVAGVEHDTLLVFLSSGCLTCREFWSAFAGDGVTLPPGTRPLIIAKDLSDESPAELAELAPRNVEVVCSSQAWTDYQVPGSPYVIVVQGSNGRVQGEGTGMSWDQVAGLLAQATGDRTYVSGETGPTVAKPVSDVEREARVDRELMEAGIFPGDPSLYPEGDDDR